MIFILLTQRSPISSLFPYTTLFRSSALQESEARLSSVIESAKDAILTIDEEQRILLFNAAAEKMFGCDASEVLGQDRKSTRLNSSHVSISYAVFCLKKKKHRNSITR